MDGDYGDYGDYGMDDFSPYLSSSDQNTCHPDSIGGDEGVRDEWLLLSKIKKTNLSASELVKGLQKSLRQVGPQSMNMII
jgi:hypothetical protein